MPLMRGWHNGEFREDYAKLSRLMKHCLPLGRFWIPRNTMKSYNVCSLRFDNSIRQDQVFCWSRHGTADFCESFLLSASYGQVIMWWIHCVLKICMEVHTDVFSLKKLIDGHWGNWQGEMHDHSDTKEHYRRKARRKYMSKIICLNIDFSVRIQYSLKTIEYLRIDLNAVFKYESHPKRFSVHPICL